MSAFIKQRAPFLSRLAGKVAIVTGGANGIGYFIANRFAREGAKVTISDLDDAAGKKFVEEIKAAGGQAHYVHAKAGNEEHTEKLIKEARDKFGPADILVNNAAAFYFGDLPNVKRETWLHLYETNVVGYADAIKYALPDFQAKGQGAVVNLASISSFIAQPDMFVYNSVKGAVVQLTRCLALDLAKYNVRVNAICPGSTWTPASARHMKVLNVSEEDGKKLFGDQAVLKRMAHGDEIAAPTLFLATEDASYITGQCLLVDGGVTII